MVRPGLAWPACCPARLTRLSNNYKYYLQIFFHWVIQIISVTLVATLLHEKNILLSVMLAISHKSHYTVCSMYELYEFNHEMFVVKNILF